VAYLTANGSEGKQSCITSLLTYTRNKTITQYIYSPLLHLYYFFASKNRVHDTKFTVNFRINRETGMRILPI